MWKDSMNIGIPTIDTQHKNLVDLILKAKKLLRFSADGIISIDELRATLYEFQIASVEHFEDEEALMALKGFTALEAHKVKHSGFLERTGSFFESVFEHNQAGVSEEVIQSFLEWTIEHITLEDKKYLAVMM